jgi:hypothetical protein
MNGQTILSWIFVLYSRIVFKDFEKKSTSLVQSVKMLFNCLQYKHYQSKMSLDENENALKLDLSIVQSTMSRATETAQVTYQ